ncbi:hypothetical protein [Nocardioides sp. WS12]|uniref:hypothetical protein n=1 Tax=Nocardioides sp. WS12 TaxID=2486272 RepID=UPI0015FAB679|nr:hypothetical protein [Nocardioides sp. WS12]
MKDVWRDIRIFVGGLLVGVVLAVLVPLAIRAISDLTPETGDDLDYVTVVSDVDPLTPRLSVVAARLDSSTGLAWQAPLLSVSTIPSQPTTLTADRIAQLAAAVTVPDVEAYSVDGVVTNLLSEDSVRANGAFYLVSVTRLGPAQDWLLENNRIFVDDAQERARETFRAGSLIFYYAPTGEVDHTDAIRRYVNEVVRCPRALGPCPG